MSEGKNFIIVKCETCGIDMQVDEKAKSIYCMKCQNWTQLKKNEDQNGKKS